MDSTAHVNGRPVGQPSRPVCQQLGRAVLHTSGPWAKHITTKAMANICKEKMVVRPASIRTDVKHHLSQSESDRLRLLLDMFDL